MPRVDWIVELVVEAAFASHLRRRRAGTPADVAGTALDADS